MASTAAIIGASTTIGYAAVGGSSYTTLAEMIDISAPGMTVGSAEATRYDSPSTYEEFLPAYKNGGEVDVEFHYLTTQAPTLMATIFGTLQSYKITLPDTHTITFNGFINAVGGPIPMKQTINQKVKIKVTGAVTYA